MTRIPSGGGLGDAAVPQRGLGGRHPQYYEPTKPEAPPITLDDTLHQKAPPLITRGGAPKI
ncbi:hypothetical protein [Altericista sp. CCNU0014]|uniref:hypothetical protein n=1 Tax=Altericista sp. CCNU0014 TaxID=3082949 RepID=UPI00384E68A5